MRRKIYHLKNIIFFACLSLLDKYFRLNSENETYLLEINGKYEKEFSEETIISNGSFGIVCRVKNENDSNYYAVKKIAMNPTERKKVIRELKIMARLKSVYVVEYIASWTEKKKYIDDSQKENKNIHYEHRVFDKTKKILVYIQMELCVNTLSVIMDKIKKELNRKDSEDSEKSEESDKSDELEKSEDSEKQEETKTIKLLQYFIESGIFKEILECVNFLHDEKIIHRDLKPDNILITHGLNGRFVKISDFGLSVEHEVDQSHSEDTGTVKFMAPEVDGRKYNMKADIYSLGVLAINLFSFQCKM
jgi:translation initiation factor 2-alpha kinase 4